MSQSILLKGEYNKKISHAAHLAAIHKAVSELVTVRRGLRGCDKRIGKNSHLDYAMDSLRNCGVEITKNALKKRVTRALQSQSPQETIINVCHVSLPTSDMSSLSSPLNDDEETLENSQSPPSAAGRPKGSTREKKRLHSMAFRACMNAIVEVYAKEVSCKKKEGKRVQKGYLDRLINEKKHEFSVEDQISKKTIHNRIKNGIISTSHPGVKSPLQAAEQALVEICIQMGKIRQPLNVTEAIALMNNLVDRTSIQQNIIAFQRSRKLGKDEVKNGKVTRGWWRGFLRRHGHKIVTKRGEKFATNRHDWTTLSNIQQMYEVIYDEFVDANVAIATPPYFTDAEGKIVDESDRYGHAQTIKITKPDWILMADESGFSTSQKKDGHVGGQRLVVENGTVPQTMACTTDHKFTLLPFTSASGQAVCCVVIFQGKQGAVPASWRTGIDYEVSPVLTGDGKEIDWQLNLGEGKYYPGGPKCMYNGKVVDCLTYASESGGITGDILIEILKYFDESDVFPRIPGGAIPVLIVDGHQSRLDPKFVEYIIMKAIVGRFALGFHMQQHYGRLAMHQSKMPWLSRSGIVKKQNSWFGRMNTAYLVQSVPRMSCQS
jgi:hypothetical protein